MTAYLLVLAVAGGAAVSLAVANWRLRRRHEAMRATLRRVAGERDALRWQQLGGGR